MADDSGERRTSGKGSAPDTTTAASTANTEYQDRDRDVDSQVSLSEAADTDATQSPSPDETPAETGLSRAEIEAELGDVDPDNLEANADEVISLAQRGADPETIAGVLTERVDDLDRQQRNQISRAILNEGSKAQLDTVDATVSLDTDEVDAVRDAFADRFGDPHGEDAQQYLETMQVYWGTSMYNEHTAPVFQVEGERTGNTRVPDNIDDLGRGMWATGEETGDPFEMETYDWHRTVAESKSEQVTELLRDAYGDTVTFYRGLDSDGNMSPAGGTSIADELSQAKADGDTCAIEHYAIESWTLDPTVAAEYGRGGVMIEAEVPVEDVALNGMFTGKEGIQAHETMVASQSREYTPDQITDAPGENTETVIAKSIEQAARLDSATDQ